VSWLADREGEAWEGVGLPTHLVLEAGDAARPAVRAIPGTVLAEAWREPWLLRGLEPPRRTVTALRAELERRARKALREAPRTELRPVSEAAFELGVPERTLRAQITSGAREAQRNGRGKLAFELPVRRPIRVRLVAEPPDPRVAYLMAADSCQPGERHRLGYRRRRDGENWREAW
jgi:hypothetical protein